MHDSKILTTFEEHLEKRYGKIGTPIRDAFELKSKAFAIGELVKEKRRLARPTKECLAERTSTKRLVVQVN